MPTQKISLAQRFYIKPLSSVEVPKAKLCQHTRRRSLRRKHLVTFGLEGRQRQDTFKLFQDSDRVSSRLLKRPILRAFERHVQR